MEIIHREIKKSHPSIVIQIIIQNQSFKNLVNCISHKNQYISQIIATLETYNSLKEPTKLKYFLQMTSKV